MPGAKPTLFVGIAVLLTKKGDEDKGEWRYTAVRLQHEQTPSFGQAYVSQDLSRLVSAVKILRKGCAKIIFDPPLGIDFRGGSGGNSGPVRRYEALELKDLNRVQVALGFY